MDGITFHVVSGIQIKNFGLYASKYSEKYSALESLFKKPLSFINDKNLKMIKKVKIYCFVLKKCCF